MAAALIMACAVAGCSASRPARATTHGASGTSLSIASAAAVRAAEASVVKVVSIQPACGWKVQSSGFAFASHHVMTLATNVAGSAGDGLHVIDARGISHAATVVLFDPSSNVAVLDVPTLTVTPLRFAGTLTPRSRVVVAGYSHDGPRPTASAAAAAIPVNALSHGIYGGYVRLQIILVQASITEGETGGPLLDQSGHVDGVSMAKRLGSAPVLYSLSQFQVRSDAAESADRTTAVSDQTCVRSRAGSFKVLRSPALSSTGTARYRGMPPPGVITWM